MGYPMASYLSTVDDRALRRRTAARGPDRGRQERPAAQALRLHRERALDRHEEHQQHQRARARTRSSSSWPTRSARRTRSTRTASSPPARPTAARTPSRSRPSRTSAAAPISIGTLAHEIAHQWFGDSVGPATLARDLVQRGLGHVVGDVLVRTSRTTARTRTPRTSISSTPAPPGGTSRPPTWGPPRSCSPRSRSTTGPRRCSRATARSSATRPSSRSRRRW